jgi:hypothetical protein
MSDIIFIFNWTLEERPVLILYTRGMITPVKRVPCVWRVFLEGYREVLIFTLYKLKINSFRGLSSVAFN